MPTPYMGRIRIACGHLACPKNLSRQDVAADCIVCPAAHLGIVDLDGKEIAGFRDEGAGTADDPPSAPAPEIHAGESAADGNAQGKGAKGRTDKSKKNYR